MVATLAVAHFDHEAMRFCATELLERQYEPAPPSTRHAYTWYRYDRRTDACWSLADPLALVDLTHEHGARLVSRGGRRYARSIRRPRGRPVFRLSPLRREGLVAYPRDQLVVTVVLRRREVYKVLGSSSSTSEPVENEVRAHELNPALTPRLLGHSAPGSARREYVVQQYLPNTVAPRWSDWPQTLTRLLDPLIDLYAAAGVRRRSLAEHVAVLERARNRSIDPSSPLGVAVSRVVERFLDLAVTAPRLADAPIFETFVHGDLHPWNLRRDRDQIRVIDWGGAGEYNVLYDLYRQYDYSDGERFWTVFPARTRQDYDDTLFGWPKIFLPAIEGVLGQRLEIQELNANLLCCVAESLLKLVRLRQGGDEEGPLKKVATVAAHVPRWQARLR